MGYTLFFLTTYPGFIGYQGVAVVRGRTEGKMSIYDNERDFILALVNRLPSISICPNGRPEEATRDKAQIKAWFRNKVPLLVLGIQLKEGR
jgi:hypothetical protein